MDEFGRNVLVALDNALGKEVTSTDILRIFNRHTSKRFRKALAAALAPMFETHVALPNPDGTEMIRTKMITVPGLEDVQDNWIIPPPSEIYNGQSYLMNA